MKGGSDRYGVRVFGLPLLSSNQSFAIQAIEHRRVILAQQAHLKTKQLERIKLTQKWEAQSDGLRCKATSPFSRQSEASTWAESKTTRLRSSAGGAEGWTIAAASLEDPKIEVQRTATVTSQPWGYSMWLHHRILFRPAPQPDHCLLHHPVRPFFRVRITGQADGPTGRHLTFRMPGRSLERLFDRAYSGTVDHGDVAHDIVGTGGFPDGLRIDLIIDLVLARWSTR
jgi:hypothetical protein